MDQIAIIPSGVNQLTSNALVASDVYLCYASTLAVYVHSNKPPGFPLLRVLTGPTKPIIGIAYDGEVLVAACEDKHVFLWELITGEQLGSTVADVQPMCVAASQWCPNRLFIGGKDAKSCIWVYREGKIMGQSMPCNGDVTCASFSIQAPNLLGIGTATGNFMLYDMAALKHVKKFDAFESLRTGGFFDKVFGDSPCINDLAFDPLSSSYVILASVTGYIILVDIDKMAIMHTFDRCNTGVTRVVWNPSEPGGFLSIDGTTNTLRVWNVSSRQPLRSYRPKNLPVTSCCIVPPHFDACAVGFDDGSIGVFNMSLKRLEMSTLPGHSETVFDIRFATHNRDLLSSGSFDRTVKVWNSKNMSLVSSIAVAGVAYCIDWAPDGSGIAVALHTGEVGVFDPKTEKARWRRKAHSDLAWRVAWNHQQPMLLASTSRDGNLVVMRSIDGEIFGSFSHKVPVFGVSWNPFEPTVLATGAFDGCVRIIGLTDQSSLVVKRILSGHQADVYNVEYHPLIPGVLASSSNDKTVRVWADVPTAIGQAANSKETVLVGHTDKVRGLCWCPAAPFLLISGSWDGTIRAWDIRTAGCIAASHNHTADVYTIATHPQRPFVIVSGSRDTTIRFFKLKLFDHVYLNAAIGSLQSVPTVEDLMRSTARKACGPQLAALLQAALPTQDPVERLALIAGFFDFPHGVADVVNCVRYLKDSRAPLDRECVITPMEVIANVAEARAVELEAAKKRVTSAVGASQLSAKLIAAAETYLRLGRVKEYCELLIDAGEWERGIAAAPMVSLEYWRSLCLRAANRLADAGDMRAVEYFVCASEGHRAADFLAARKEHTEAMLVVQHCPQRADTPETSSAGVTTQLPPQVDARMSLEKLAEFSRQRAEAFVAVGNPNLAAAAFAAAGVTDHLVLALVRGGSAPLAHLVIHAVPLPSELLDVAFINSMIACAAMQEWASAVTCCRRTANRVSAAATLLALYRCAGYSNEAALAFAEQLGLDQGSVSAPAAVPARQTAHLVTAGRWGEAINHGLGVLEDIVVELQQPTADATLPTDRLEDARTLAGQIVFTTNVAENRRVLRCAYLVGEALARRYGFARLGPVMLAAALFCSEDSADKAQLEERIRVYHVGPASPFAQQFSPLGSNLPNNNVDGKRAMSFISDAEVSGPPVLLEDGKNVISAQEAQLWHQCCWFSPLATGERLFPYH